jgi:hypothetical protein
MTEEIKLSDAAREVLATTIVVGRWYVSADNICTIAELITAGLVTATDDYNNIGVFYTDKAVKLAVALNLVETDDTDNGFKFVDNTSWLSRHLGIKE